MGMQRSYNKFSISVFQREIGIEIEIERGGVGEAFAKLTMVSLIVLIYDSALLRRYKVSFYKLQLEELTKWDEWNTKKGLSLGVRQRERERETAQLHKFHSRQTDINIRSLFKFAQSSAESLLINHYQNAPLKTTTTTTITTNNNQ